MKVAQSCPNSLRPHTVHGSLQARILEWVTFPFSSGSSQPRNQSPALQVDSAGLGGPDESFLCVLLFTYHITVLVLPHK